MSQPDNQEQLKTLKLKIELPKCLSVKSDIVEIDTTYDETLPQLKDTLGLIPKTENLTNFHIYYQNINLVDTFSEMVTFGDMLEALELQVDTLFLKLVEKPYNLSNVYEHLLKFRQVIGLHLLDRSNMDFGVCGGSSKLAGLGLTSVKTEQLKPKETKETKESESESKKEESAEPELSADSKSIITSIADTLLSNDSVDLLKLGSFTNPYKNLKIPLKSLTVSQWSPVPQHRKVKGDLLYLSLQTLENEVFQVTCHYSGFYINKSSTVTFNPELKDTIKVPKHFLLFDLIRNLSPLFESTIIENNSSLHLNSDIPETYLLPSNSFVSYPWVVNEDSLTNNSDLTQSQLPLLNGGVDGGDTVRDWNEEFQSIKELPRTTINERILRGKLLSKTIFEFNKSATETAIHIINGDITSLNISEDPEQLTYLRNGIFYSYGVDATGNFEQSGGDEAARYTTGKDLNTIKLLNRIDSVEVHNLLTLVVDYMGKRIVCQAPVPGIFQETRDLETNEVVDKVVYGLNSDNTQINHSDSFDKCWKDIADAFHLKPHTVELSDDLKTAKELVVSKDMKGLQGTDGRKYMIDTYRTVPIDISFVDKHYRPQSETSYPHKEALVRHEAVEEWWRRKIAVLLKQETERLEKEGKDVKEDGEKPQIVVKGDSVSFNPDAFTGINESKEDQDETREVSEFIMTLIDEFLTESSSQLVAFDGTHLSSLLHKSGINLRYLGYIAEQCLVRKQKEIDSIKSKIEDNEKLAAKLADENAQKQKEQKDKESAKEENKEEENQKPSAGVFEPIVANYDTIFNLSIVEMVSRAVKNTLRKLAKTVPVNLMSSFVSHFFNCLLGSEVNRTPICFVDEDLKSFYGLKDLHFTTLTSDSVLQLVAEEVFIRYRYELPQHWINTIAPHQLLREASIKFGIQWKAQKYVFTKEEFETLKDAKAEANMSKKNKKSKKHSPVVEKVIPRQSVFVPEDILNFVPLIKDSSFKPSLLDEVSETAKIELSKDQNNGLMLYNELLSFYEQIFGRVHPDTAAYYSHLSQLYADLNMPIEAATLARVSCVLNERVHGLDSYSTITSYVNAAYFEAINKEYVNSFKLYQHAIELWKTSYGEEHPSFITTYANLGDILTNIKLFDSSKKLLQKSIELSTKLNGEVSEVTGLISYRYAYSLIAANNYKASKDNFESAYQIFNKVLGPEDTFTEKSLNFATNIRTYLDYQKHEKSKKEVKVPKKPVLPKKTKKTKAIPKINEDIASKSVDDILAFIEGPNKKN